MKKLIAITALTAASMSAANLTSIAAGTTIAVNVLEIRTTTAKVLKVWKRARKLTAKAARKVAGKK